MAHPQPSAGDPQPPAGYPQPPTVQPPTAHPHPTDILGPTGGPVVVLAPDSFKESMSAEQACAALEVGVLRAWPTARCLWRPMADGGEGTVAAVLRGAAGAHPLVARTHDALTRPRTARLAWFPDTATALVEVAEGPGLEHIAPDERDIWAATSAGVGEMLLAAFDAGARRIVIGLGGSASNDGGAGMLQALGARFLGDGDRPVDMRGPRTLGAVSRIDASGLDARLADTEVVVASDVTNPLLGPAGASAVFAPQKGATPEDVGPLDASLARLADMGARATGRDLRDAPGAGAAGGIGWACLAFLGATMRPGVEMVAELVDLDGALRGADLVLTGEGSVDAQTLVGKTPWGVARLALARRVPVVVIAGRVGGSADELVARGVTAVVPMVRDASLIDEGGMASLMEAGPGNLAAAAETVCRLSALVPPTAGEHTREHARGGPTDRSGADGGDGDGIPRGVGGPVDGINATAIDADGIGPRLPV